MFQKYKKQIFLSLIISIFLIIGSSLIPVKTWTHPCLKGEVWDKWVIEGKTIEFKDCPLDTRTEAVFYGIPLIVFEYPGRSWAHPFSAFQFGNILINFIFYFTITLLIIIGIHKLKSYKKII